jgi:4-hydroxybenzoate polyprenyltransferase
MSHTDIQSRFWLDRLLPPKLRPYLRLARLDRPVGTWLLFLPGAWAIAAFAPSLQTALWLLLLFGLGALVMRSAGCVVNDMLDRKFDAQVERTRSRPLASGVISIKQAAVFLALLLLLGLVILLQMNLADRWSWCFLAAVGWRLSFHEANHLVAAGLARADLQLGRLAGVCGTDRAARYRRRHALCRRLIFWTLGYDTIYAHQDKDDDELIGVKSTARLLGAASPRWIAAFYAVMVLLLAGAGFLVPLGFGYFLGLLLVAWHLFRQLKNWQLDDPVDCLARFKANRNTGLLMLLAIVAGRITF